jgi:glucokinase
VHGVIGVDVGGTSVKAGVITSGGPSLRRRVATPRHRGPDAVVETILSAVEDVVAAAAGGGCEVTAVGLATLGIVDEAQQIARWSATVGWRDVPLGALVAERVGIPVVVGHDVRTAALVETTLGAGRGHRSAVFVGLGTGLSAAHVIEGQALPGATWQSGEIGQVPVSGRDGQRTTLEALASAHALATRYGRETGRSNAVDAAVVVDAARDGDPAAERTLDEALHHLAGALAVVISFADPSVVIVGGGLSLAGEALLTPLRKQIADALGWREPPPLEVARFGDEAGWVGAALLAWRRAGQPDDRFPQDSWP